MAKLHEWLRDSLKEDRFRHVHAAPDGTFAVYIEHFEHEPIYGVPTEKMAEEICEAMSEAASSASYNTALEIGEYP